MNPDIIKYFESIGFEVDWDFSKSGAKWYEFYYDQEMLCQIDMGIPLDQMLKDLRFYKYKTGKQEGSEDYVISAPPDKFKKFLDLLPI